MEVHPYPHTERKRLKHYLFEFLMLFLAVFAGFIAENLREHFVDHKKEKQYILSLIEDIRADIANVDTIINDYKTKVPRIDSLLLNFGEFMKGYSPSFQHNISATWGFMDFFPTDRTMQQLKYAGGLRLIKNQAVSDSIMCYDRLIRDVMLEQDNMGQQHFVKIWDKNFLFFDEYKYDSLKLHKTDAQIDKERPYSLMATNRRELVEYYSRLKALKGNFFLFIDELEILKNEGTRLITVLQKEYHLK